MKRNSLIRRVLLLFACTSLLGLSSCVDNDYSNPAFGQVAVVFIPQIEGCDTRAIDQSWSASDQVGICMVTHEAALPKGSSFSQYQVSGAGTSVSLSPAVVDQTLFYPTDGSNVNFVAFSPYATVTDNTVSYTDFADQSTQADMEKVDFLYHKDATAYNKTSTTAALAFGHKLSKIIVYVTTTSNDDGAVTLSSLAMTIAGTPGSVSANLADGSITAGGSDATITPYHTSPDANTRIATAIIAPHEAKADRTITFTADEGNHTYTFPSDEFAFESNKVYTLNFVVTRQSVTLTNTTIDNWTSGTIDWTGKYLFELLNDSFSFTAAENTTTTMTFNSNSGTAPAVVFSTSQTDAQAGTPEGDWVTGELTTNDQTDYTQYTYTFDVTENTDGPFRTAYAHILNGSTSLAVIPIKQKGTYEYAANCYVVKPGSNSILIPVTRANEHVAWMAAAGVTDDTATPIGDGDELTAVILWSEVQNMVTVEPVGTGSIGAIKVTTTATANTEGNAVVAVKVNGVIKWSWHIWVTNYEPTPIGDLGWMDRHLGATSNSKSTIETERVKTFGLLYQWGRKDPFPRNVVEYSSVEPVLYNGEEASFIYEMSDSEVSGLGVATVIKSEQSISYTVANPLTFICIYGGWQNSPEPTTTDNNWGHQDGKELYDPCPEGYRVPKSGSWGTTSWENTYPYDQTYRGRDLFPYGGWYPGPGYIDCSTCKLVSAGWGGDLWSATPVQLGSLASKLYLQTYTVNPTSSNYRSYGLSIRCVSE